ncbi:hypothetical protein SDC9_66043 [bioreactor metagenome]|uniref:Uncharacterized protein n=1 Tax=bioreactor metagenome TaxID=1076179 RepID=A0A644XUN6_9ZZZZ
MVDIILVLYCYVCNLIFYEMVNHVKTVNNIGKTYYPNGLVCFSKLVVTINYIVYIHSDFNGRYVEPFLVIAVGTAAAYYYLCIFCDIFVCPGNIIMNISIHCLDIVILVFSNDFFCFFQHAFRRCKNNYFIQSLSSHDIFEN